MNQEQKKNIKKWFRKFKYLACVFGDNRCYLDRLGKLPGKVAGRTGLSFGEGYIYNDEGKNK